MNLHRFFLLTTVSLAIGMLIAAGCSDDETTVDTTTTTTNQGGSGGTDPGDCTPADICEECAAEECTDLALACCGQTGCNELLRCVAVDCDGDSEDIACITTECIDELNAAGGATGPGTTAAIDLGECLTPALETPTNPKCQTCADMFATGGAGGTGGSGGTGG